MDQMGERRVARDRTVSRGILGCALFGAALGLGFTVYTISSDDRPRIDLSQQQVSFGGVTKPLAIRFLKNGAGDIEIVEPRTSRTIKRIPEARKGFIDPLVRSLMRERMRHEADQTAPYLLAKNELGHLTITDPKTGTLIYLQAFGPTNIALFNDIANQEGLKQ